MAAKQFSNLPAEERARFCREVAAQAAGCADLLGEPSVNQPFRTIAKHWTSQAEAMEAELLGHPIKRAAYRGNDGSFTHAMTAEG
jgi:hypothetical protein